MPTSGYIRHASSNAVSGDLHSATRCLGDNNLRPVERPPSWMRVNQPHVECLWGRSGDALDPGPDRGIGIEWWSVTCPDSEPLFRLFFEAYGIALRHPQPYKAFLRATVEDWLRLIADPLCRKGYARGKARAFATVVLAGLRGFMLDFCNTRDRKRLDHALSLWLRTLDPMLSDPEEA
jgi:hypothetical protein